MLKISKAAAGYKGQTIDSLSCSVCTMFVPPAACTLVEGNVRPGGWCKYFVRSAKRTKELGKVTVVSDFKFFLPITKVDAATRTISGYASTPAKDSDGEIVTLDAVRAALPDYMRWGNIREMHKLSAVGVAQDANIDGKGLFLTAKIVDDGAWKKCVEGVYKGFSIGGKKLDRSGNKITEIDMTEISVVDRPANPDCSFALAKSAKNLGNSPGYLVKKGKDTSSVEQKALRKMAKVVEALTKAGPPAAHDGFSLPAKPSDTELSPNDSRPSENATRKAGGEAGAPCEAHGKVNCALCAVAKAGDAPDNGKLPYGNETYADPGYRNEKKRYPLTEGGKPSETRIRAAWNYIHKKKNEGKYDSTQLGHIRGKIIAAWKAHIDPKGPPAARVAKAEVAVAMLGLHNGNTGFLTLHKSAGQRTAARKSDGLVKGMSTAGSLSYVFDALRNAQRSLMVEGKAEGGDKKDHVLAARLGALSKELAGIISQKAEHEGGEATDMSDADDKYLRNMLGDPTMTTNDTMTRAAGGDPISSALLDMVKRAAQPTRAQRMAMAEENVKKSRKAAKAAREAIEKAHKMHKDAFLSKAAKKDGKGSEDDGEFDHAGAMEKLQEAYSEIDKARTFGKAAMSQIKKASGRAGERGQEAGDPEAGFYQVPAGVKDLTPAALAGASPGGVGYGSQPPLYPVDGSVYPGKAAGGGDLAKFAKNGQVPAEVMELLLEKAKTDGELEALRRLPMSAAGARRPYNFDTTKVFGGNSGGPGAYGTGDPGALNKALFTGVDVGALSSNDERAHTEASAKVIGNFITSGQFGKSVFDPAFKGAAGVG